MVAIWSGLGVIETANSLKVALLLAGFGIVGLALSGCAEGPGYGPGYYGSAAIGYGAVFPPYGYGEPYGFGPGYAPATGFYRHYADDDDRDFDRDRDADGDHDADDDDRGGDHDGDHDGH